MSFQGAADCINSTPRYIPNRGQSKHCILAVNMLMHSTAQMKLEGAHLPLPDCPTRARVLPGIT